MNLVHKVEGSEMVWKEKEVIEIKKRRKMGRNDDE